ncbi:MAG: hypothetical protein QXO48_03645 [Desulfurococcaceae archaeon]
MLYKITTIAAVAVTVVLAALLGMYYIETIKLGLQVENYKSQVAALNATVERQKAQINTLTSEVDSLQRHVSTLRQYSQDLERQRDELQRQVSTLKLQIQDLEKQRNSLRSELDALRNELDAKIRENEALRSEKRNLERVLERVERDLERITEELNQGPKLVERFKAMLTNIRIDAPQIVDRWTFKRTSRYSGELRPNYYYRWEFYLYAGASTIEVTASPALQISIYRWDEFVKYAAGVSDSPVARGWGRLRFTPRENGTYVVIILNTQYSTVYVDIEITQYETWYFCEEGQRCPRPYVTGPPIAKDFFRLFALYNYWLNNRETFARQVQRQYPDLSTQEAYALSLAALLRSAGFGATPAPAFTTATPGVSFAAISFSKYPLDPISVIVSLTLPTQTNPRDIYNTLFNTLPMGWIHTITIYTGDAFIILVDTYNVYERLDRDESSSYFNIIYIDGYTTLPT